MFEFAYVDEECLIALTATKIFNLQTYSENVGKCTKSEFKRGHRKSLFTAEQRLEIIYKFTHNKISKTALAREYHCSEKTIRNIINCLAHV